MRDELYHVEWARALASGDWLGSHAFFSAPLYPYILGILLRVSDGSLTIVRHIQAVYGSLVPVLTYLVGRRVAGERAGLVAGLVACCYPFLIYFDNELLIVSLIVLLDVLMLLAVLRADRVPTWGRWLTAGVVMGFSAIARPNVLVFIPLLFVWIWLAARGAGKRDLESRGRPGETGDTHGRLSLVGGATPLLTAAARFALFLVGVALIVSPVTLRNAALDDDFVLIASQGGVNFYIGNNEQADGISAVVPGLGEAWRYTDCERVAERESGARLKPSDVSGYWYGLGRRFLRDHPGAAAQLYLKKFVLFWDSFELANNKDIYFFGRMSPIFRSLSWLHFGIIAPLAFVGIWVARRRKEASLLAFFLVSYMACVLLFFINARYRLPVIPVIIIFSSTGALWLWDRARSRQWRPLAVGLLAVAAVAVFVNVDFYGTHVGDRAQTHNTLGLAQASAGKYDDAVAEYLRAVELSPGYAKAYNNMGISLERLGNVDEAFAAYTRAAELDPGLASVRNNIGTLFWRRGDLPEASKWFREALKRDPWMREARYNLGAILTALGEWKEAEEQLRLAVEANPDFKEAWNDLAVVLEESGRAGPAIAAYHRAILIDPGYAEARNNLGILLARTGQYGEALLELGIALRLAPGDRNIIANIEQVRELERRQHEDW
jgi:Flp pilus assembly protein TadD